MKNSVIIGFLFILIQSLPGCTENEGMKKDSGDILTSEEKVNISVPVFPLPSMVSMKEGEFLIDRNTSILIPGKVSANDEFIAELLFNELTDRYNLPVRIVNGSTVPEEGNSILIGDLDNTLIKKYCSRNGLYKSLIELGEEGYIISVDEKTVVVASNSSKGSLYGLETLRQLIRREGERIFVPRLVVKDSPEYPFRGIKLYLPGRENITFFKRFIKDFVALYKFNKIILELNANMRLEKHPELNIGTIGFERHLNFSRLDRPPGLHQEYQNSSHQDNADGGILEKEEVADLVEYIRKFNIEVIPELPSLTHSYYLLFGHEDLAENINQPYPDTYCPLKPGIYKIYFDVLDEYIDVIHPDMIHVGHDEWRMEKDICELCRGKDYGQLYADDLIKIHDYLAGKGIKTAIWGDHLLESVTERDHQTWKSSSGYQYKIPGALRPEQVIQLIPKDIIIFNWFWDNINNDKQLSEFGFRQVYGNFLPEIENWNERDKISGILGGAPSSWAATTEHNIGKDQLYDFLGCANLLWSEHYLPADQLALAVEPMISKIYSDLSGKTLPSNAGSRVVPVNIAAKFNSSLSEGIDSLDSSGLQSGNITSGKKLFYLDKLYGNDKKAVVVRTDKNHGISKSVEGIEINNDVNSIIFLHACAKEGSNKKAYDRIYNFGETAQLIGWYEVIYEDGYEVIIPVRYGLNILDWGWKKRITGNYVSRIRYNQNKYAYQASAVECSEADSETVTFFAYEWENLRYGEKIKTINLNPVDYEKDNENAIILIAISVTEIERPE